MCLASLGTDRPKECVFPFKDYYVGTVYTGCTVSQSSLITFQQSDIWKIFPWKTKINGGTEPWCALSIKSGDGNFYDEWGFCNMTTGCQRK